MYLLQRKQSLKSRILKLHILSYAWFLRPKILCANSNEKASVANWFFEYYALKFLLEWKDLVKQKEKVLLHVSNYSLHTPASLVQHTRQLAADRKEDTWRHARLLSCWEKGAFYPVRKKKKVKMTSSIRGCFSTASSEKGPTNTTRFLLQ